MDLLEQYKQQHPEAFTKKKSPQYSDQDAEYSTLVRLAMRLSGGRIKNPHQANIALLIVACLSALLAFYLFFGPGSSSAPPPPAATTQEELPQ